MIEGIFTVDEMEFAAMVGCRRQIRSIVAGRKDAYGKTGDPWESHILGAMGEEAYAKARDKFWTGMGEGFEDDSDVGGVQIRCRSRHDYELYVWPEEKADRWFVLVTCVPPVWRVHGYIWGAEAKRPEWKKSLGREPAYFPPTRALTPIMPSPATNGPAPRGQLRPAGTGRGQ